jgi:ubiquinone/menaquinone biosynthesis C-methylase UbiE
VHLVPVLKRGHYVGTDIAQAILDRAKEKLNAHTNSGCKITLLRQETERFPVADASVDMICAFSVFTHMEHEDAWRYLVDARRIIKPRGKFVFSCLTMDQPTARNTFLASAAGSFQARWSRVRDITTSRDLMNSLAEMTGWTPSQWFAGDEANILIQGAQGPQALGQSVCVLEAK